MDSRADGKQDKEGDKPIPESSTKPTPGSSSKPDDEVFSVMPIIDATTPVSANLRKRAKKSVEQKKPTTTGEVKKRHASPKGRKSKTSLKLEKTVKDLPPKKQKPERKLAQKKPAETQSCSNLPAGIPHQIGKKLEPIPSCSNIGMPKSTEAKKHRPASKYDTLKRPKEHRILKRTIQRLPSTLASRRSVPRRSAFNLRDRPSCSLFPTPHPSAIDLRRSSRSLESLPATKKSDLNIPLEGYNNDAPGTSESSGSKQTDFNLPFDIFQSGSTPRLEIPPGEPGSSQLSLAESASAIPILGEEALQELGDTGPVSDTEGSPNLLTRLYQTVVQFFGGNPEEMQFLEAPEEGDEGNDDDEPDAV